MNRAKAEQITDRILARMEQDGDGRGPVAHRESIIEEIIAGDALDEIVDIITVDDGKMTHRDGTPFNRDADKHPDYLEHVRKQQADSVTEIQAVLRDMLFTGAGIYRLQPDGFWSADLDDRDTA